MSVLSIEQSAVSSDIEFRETFENALQPRPMHINEV